MADSVNLDQMSHSGSTLSAEAFLLVLLRVFAVLERYVIALDKVLFSTKKYLYFSYFLTKTYVVGTH